jgi:UDP-N-acetylglucosamine 1-carboxyvinyltransferase
MIINGLQEVSGSIKVSGAKNSVLPLMCAALLSKGEIKLKNVPNLNDVKVLANIISKMGRKVLLDKDTLTFSRMENMEYDTDLPTETSNIRYSVLLLGSLLTTVKSLNLPLPGGCNFSARPIDLHLRGLEELGANILEYEEGIKANTDRLKGTEINLKFPSVGATENLIIASVLAQGITRITNIAREPEIEDLIKFLCVLGANIKFVNPSAIEIIGVDELSTGNIEYEVMPDRIEAATYAILGALSSENHLRIENFIVEHNLKFLNVLQKVGVGFEILDSKTLVVYRSSQLKGASIESDVFPGLATDIQPLLAVLLTQAEGNSTIIDNIYPSRFQYADYLIKMGANIKYINNGILIQGKTILRGQEVYSTDLRGGAAMVLAGLIASGTTNITNTYQIFRGYSDLIFKLNNIGVTILEEEQSMLKV